MDYKDILAQIQKDVDTRTQEILSKSQKTIDSFLKPSDQHEKANDSPNRVQKFDILIKDNRLDGSTQAKIGTFERLYFGNYMGDTSVALYGYDDLDYASLVNLLASALEIELNQSLYQLIRKDIGISMPDCWCKETGRLELSIGNKVINVGKASQMYGALIALFSRYRREVSSVVGESDPFIAQLSDIAEFRNKADHTEMIDKDSFIAFYPVFSGFFNSYIGHLLDLKVSLQQNESSSSKVNAYQAIDSYSSDKDDYITRLKATASQEPKEQRGGVIFTNTRELAIKYFNNVNYEGGDSLMAQIYQCLVEYSKAVAARTGIVYDILDLGHGRYANVAGEKPDWRICLNALDDYCERNDICGKSPWFLYIIGGDDVIPMPRFRNPCYSEYDENKDLDHSDSTVDSDAPYAYPGKNIKITSTGLLSLDALADALPSPRFHVGRLPLENGFMKTRIEDDIIRLFKRTVDAFSEGGIRIETPLMTTMQRCVTVCQYLIDGIPAVLPAALPKDMCRNNMVTSPLLKVADDSHGNCYGVDEYVSVLSHSDMLLFFLHGSPGPTSCSLSGEPRWRGEEYREFPKAFSPQLLAAGVFKSIAAISCFGARFINYSREHSLLLSAMYKDTVSYMGSSRSALGVFDDTHESHPEMPVMRLANRLYHDYLQLFFSGVPGGEALNMARIRFMHCLRGPENPDVGSGMLTFLEFNYFGDPALRMLPLIDKAQFDNNVCAPLPYSCDGDSWERKYEPVYIQRGKENGLLSRLRMMVDSNFEIIHKTIADNLYAEFGLSPRSLYSAHRFESKCGEKGYTFCYRTEQDGVIADTLIETDLTGAVKNIMHTY